MGWKDKTKEKEYDREYYLKHRERRLLYQKQYRLNNLDKVKLSGQNYRLKHRLYKIYGLTQLEHQNLLIKQNYSCPICLKTQDELKKSLVVDHCHKTGKVRGLLCSTCNRALGFFKDSAQLLLRALGHLQNV